MQRSMLIGNVNLNRTSSEYTFFRAISKKLRERRETVNILLIVATIIFPTPSVAHTLHSWQFTILLIYFFDLECMLSLFNHCSVQSSVNHYESGGWFLWRNWNFSHCKFDWNYFTIVKTNLLSTFTFDKNTKHEGSNYILN